MYITDTQAAAMRAGNDDITNFFSPSKFQLCWICKLNAWGKLPRRQPDFD